MNLETEKSMSRSELSTTPKRTAELEELLIDAGRMTSKCSKVTRWSGARGCCCWD